MRDPLNTRKYGFKRNFTTNSSLFLSSSWFSRLSFLEEKHETSTQQDWLIIMTASHEYSYVVDEPTASFLLRVRMNMAWTVNSET